MRPSPLLCTERQKNKKEEVRTETRTLLVCMAHMRIVKMSQSCGESRMPGRLGYIYHMETESARPYLQRQDVRVKYNLRRMRKRYKGWRVQDNWELPHNLVLHMFNFKQEHATMENTTLPTGMVSGEDCSWARNCPRSPYHSCVWL